MGEGELLCTGSALPFSILPISLRLSPVPQRSHAAHWAAGRGGHLLPGSPGGLGCGLQWRAAASRWNFLTNTRRRRPPLPGRGAARGSLARAPRQVRGARAVTQGEGRWTVHVDPAGFPGLEAKGIPRFPLRTRGPAQCGSSGVSRPASAAARIGSIPRRSPRPPAPPPAPCPQRDSPMSMLELRGLGRRRPPRPSGARVGETIAGAAGRTNGRTFAPREVNFAGEPRGRRALL